MLLLALPPGLHFVELLGDIQAVTGEAAVLEREVAEVFAVGEQNFSFEHLFAGLLIGFVGDEFDFVVPSFENSRR